MANKKTQKEFFNDIIALAKANDREDLVEFAQSRIDAIDKKSANKKQTATQAENEGLKVKIAEVLGGFEKATVSELMKADTELGALSNQKVTALLRQMVADGKVVKTADKKKSYFSIA